VEAGDCIVLAWSRGGRQVIDRQSGATVDVPRRPTIWIEIREPELRDGIWLIRYAIRDRREPLRRLAPVPGPRSSGLRTRQRPAEAVPRRGEAREPWTPETERGYGAGRVAIDQLEAVDDATLSAFAAEARRKRTESLEALGKESQEMSEELRRKRERAVRDRLRQTLIELHPDRQMELLATLEREILSAREAA